MLFLSLILAQAGKIAVLPTAESPALIKIAKEALDAPFWGDYVWLAEDRLLSWDRSNNPDETGWGTDPEQKLPRKYLPQIFWLDGRSLMMYEFIKGQKKSPSLSSFAALSRDSKWILWFSAPEHIGPTQWWEAASLDQMQFLGARFESPPLTYGLESVKQAKHEFFLYKGEAIWRTDGQSWVMMRGTKKEPLYDLFSIKEQRLVKEIKLPPIDLVQPDDKGDLGPCLLGYTHGKTMLGFAEGGRIEGKDKIEAFTISDDGNPKSLRRFFFQLPQPSIYDEVQLSPKGDKLAWLVYLVNLKEEHWDIDMVRRQIWISSCDGKDWKLIGDYQPQGEEKFPPKQIRWLTDGKCLSFLYGQKLWIVHAQ